MGSEASFPPYLTWCELYHGNQAVQLTMSFFLELIIVMLETSVLAKSLNTRYPLHCPVAKDLIPLPFPHPDDCSSFFLCTNGTFLQLRCSQDLFFDGYERECRNKEEVNCKNQPRRPQPAFAVCPPVNGEDVVMFPHPVECSMYYVCDHGIPYPKKCPEGLHYNRKLRVCDYKHAAKCVQVVVTKQ